MTNKIASSYAGLVSQANQAIAGVEANAVPLNITLVTSAAFTTELNAYIAKETLVKQARAELVSRKATLRTQKKNAYIYAALSRDVVKPFLGQQHSSAWDETGFVQSLQLPRNEETLLQLLLALAAYFTAHPDQENALLNVTAARATTFYNDIKAARNAVNSQKTTLAQALTARNVNADNLREMIRALLRELGVRLDDMDDRWASFGFNKPGAQHTPDVPENVEVVLVGTNALSVKWGAAARAEYYRVWKKVIGVDEEMIPVGSPADLAFLLESLPANGTVEIAVSAVNNGGESLKSAVVSITL